VTGAAVIRTERLRLRRLEQRDFDELFSLFQDPLVMRYYPALKSHVETQAWLDRVFAAYASHGHGLFAVERESDGAFLGQCGLMPQVVDGEALIEFGFGELGLATLISLVRPENKPSRAVAERNGMAVARTTTWKGVEHCIYAVENPAR
jgi:ribosomal-protein-alanine N-acetyltransferase